MRTPLDRYRDAELTLTELSQAARDLLGRAGTRADDERITTYPDERTVRYYQTLGLIARPLRYDGRRAMYGFGHLLRVIGVKLLQSEGYTLSQVQRALPTMGDAKLEAALLQLLGEDPGERPVAAAPPALVAVELAPGVVVTIDPRRVHDPQGLVATLSRAIANSSGGSP